VASSAARLGSTAAYGADGWSALARVVAPPRHAPAAARTGRVEHGGRAADDRYVYFSAQTQNADCTPSFGASRSRAAPPSSSSRAHSKSPWTSGKCLSKATPFGGVRRTSTGLGTTRITCWAWPPTTGISTLPPALSKAAPNSRACRRRLNLVVRARSPASPRRLRRCQQGERARQERFGRERLGVGTIAMLGEGAGQGLLGLGLLEPSPRRPWKIFSQRLAFVAAAEGIAAP